jgi:hypothetical protein
MSQLTLFPDLSSSSTLPIVEAPRPCRQCGGFMAALLSSHGPHAGELRCSACDTHIQWASHDLVAEIRLASASS